MTAPTIESVADTHADKASKAPNTPRSAAAAPRKSTPKSEAKRAAEVLSPDKAPSKLDQVEALLLLLRKDGASIGEMMAATGWQQHSVRGALAGALKKRGLAITSEKTDGIRRYRAVKPA